METKPWAIGLVIFITIITTSAQLLYKYGVDQVGVPLNELLKEGIVHAFTSLFLNPFVFAGMAAYAIGAVLLIIALKGGDVTVLFPIIATSYLWVVISSHYLYGSSLTLLKILGVIVLIAGVVLIGTTKPQQDRGETND
ncbi:MAG: EamA family transporter [Nanoarchaeota archaeon]